LAGLCLVWITVDLVFNEVFEMGIFKFFVGKNGSNAALPPSDSRTKYEAAFKNYERCYNDYWSSGKKENNIIMIQAGIETFSHKVNHKAIYTVTYKPVVDIVLNFLYLLRVQESLFLMDTSLKNSANTTLKRFDKKREEIKSLVENEEKVGRVVAQFLMSGNIFKKSIDTRLSREAAGIFPLYVALSIAEKEYYHNLCNAREKTHPTSQVHL
jgi:hypothetical protein